jgi:hypothetical protein
MLPAAVPNARIMRFGYQSAWFGEDVIRTDVVAVANSLLAALRDKRKVSDAHRFSNGTDISKTNESEAGPIVSTAAAAVHRPLFWRVGCFKGMCVRSPCSKCLKSNLTSSHLHRRSRQPVRLTPIFTVLYMTLSRPSPSSEPPSAEPNRPDRWRWSRQCTAITGATSRA